MFDSLTHDVQQRIGNVTVFFQYWRTYHDASGIVHGSMESTLLEVIQHLMARVEALERDVQRLEGREDD